ncbi:hypothetical protein D3C73_1560800 [compost metagenome]
MESRRSGRRPEKAAISEPSVRPMRMAIAKAMAISVSVPGRRWPISSVTGMP